MILNLIEKIRIPLEIKHFGDEDEKRIYYFIKKGYKITSWGWRPLITKKDFLECENIINIAEKELSKYIQKEGEFSEYFREELDKLQETHQDYYKAQTFSQNS